MMRVKISRRDTADTAIRVESLLDPSLPFSLTSVTVTPGTEVDICTEKVNYDVLLAIYCCPRHVP